MWYSPSVQVRKDRAVNKPDALLNRIAAAFDAVPRPANNDLLHPMCMDDVDILTLYDVADWRDLTGEMVEYEYAALNVLSPAGFRHFLPAYLCFALRHPESGAAVIETTIRALTPTSFYDESFITSKFVLLNEEQCAVIVAFLEYMDVYEDTADALGYWWYRDSDEGA
jgi:hypothetical protein